MYLDELFSEQDLQENIANGFVRAQRHPHFPLTIYNYTKHTQITQTWNDVTLNTRGLIVEDAAHTARRKIIARPFAKFFNYGELGADHFDSDERVFIMDKVDGSLGIGYRYDNRWWIATRGSFASEQSIEANKMLESLYRDWMTSDALVDATPLFEIIYPENRIVVDYDNERKLVALGTVSHSIGQFQPSVRNWQHEHCETSVFNVRDDKLTNFTLLDALNLADRENREGYVVYSLDGMRRVKIKQRDYIEKHRAIFSMTRKRIYKYAIALVTRTYRLFAQNEEHFDRQAALLAGFHTDVEAWRAFVEHAYENWEDVMSMLSASQRDSAESTLRELISGATTQYITADEELRIARRASFDRASLVRELEGSSDRTLCLLRHDNQTDRAVLHAWRRVKRELV